MAPLAPLPAAPRLVASISVHSRKVCRWGSLGFFLSAVASLAIFWPILVKEDFEAYLQCDGPQHGRLKVRQELQRLKRAKASGHSRRLALQERSQPRFFIRLIYETRDGSNLFTKEGITGIRDVENGIENLPSFGTFCLNSGDGRCARPFSVVNYFFARLDPTSGTIIPDGRGRSVLPIQAILANLGNTNPYFLDRQFGVSKSELQEALEGNITRSVIRFGLPLRGYSDVEDDLEGQREKFAAFVHNELYPYLQHASTEFLKVYFSGDVITQEEVTSTVFHDAAYAIGSLAFIFVYLVCYLRSFSLATSALACIALSFPISYGCYCIVYGHGKMIAINFLSLFVVLGVGADDVFVLHDVWVHSRAYGTGEMVLARRLWSMYCKAGMAIFATSATTAASFFANLASSIGPLRQFGFFMGTCITVNWIIVATLYPLILVNHERSRSSKCNLVVQPEIEAGVQMQEQLVSGILQTDEEDNSLSNGFQGSPERQKDIGFAWKALSGLISLLGVGVTGISLACSVHNLRPANSVPQFFPKDSNLGALQDLQMRFGNETRISGSELRICDGVVQTVDKKCAHEAAPSPPAKHNIDPEPIHLPGLAEAPNRQPSPIDFPRSRSPTTTPLLHSTTHFNYDRATKPITTSHDSFINSDQHPHKATTTAIHHATSKVSTSHRFHPTSVPTTTYLRQASTNYAAHQHASHSGEHTRHTTASPSAVHRFDSTMSPFDTRKPAASATTAQPPQTTHAHFIPATTHSPHVDVHTQVQTTAHTHATPKYPTVPPAPENPVTVPPATTPPRAFYTTLHPTTAYPFDITTILTTVYPLDITTIPTAAFPFPDTPSHPTLHPQPHRPSTDHSHLPSDAEQHAAGDFDVHLRVVGHTQEEVQELEDMVRDQIEQALGLQAGALTLDVHPERRLASRNFQSEAVSQLQADDPPFQVTLHFHHLTAGQERDVQNYLRTNQALLEAFGASQEDSKPASSASQRVHTTAPPLAAQRTHEYTTIPSAPPATRPQARYPPSPPTRPPLVWHPPAPPPPQNRVPPPPAPSPPPPPSRPQSKYITPDVVTDAAHAQSSPLELIKHATPPPLHMAKRGMTAERQGSISILWGVREVNSAHSYEPDPAFDFEAPEAQLAIVKFCDRIREFPDLKVINDKTRWNCWPQLLKDHLVRRARAFPTFSLHSAVTDFLHQGAPAYVNDHHDFNDDGTMMWVLADFRCEFDDLGSAREIQKFLDKWEARVNQVNEEVFHTFAGSETSLGRGVPVSDMFQRAEAENRVVSSALSSWLVSVGCALVALAFFTRSIGLSALACFAMFSTAACSLFFITSVWSWRFGLMEAVSLIIFCGFSVDYPLHVVQAYVLERDQGAGIKAALKEVGFAVISGCVTTCGAALFLLLCEIRIFTRFGKVLVVNMLFACFFALIWIPAVLEFCSCGKRRGKRKDGLENGGLSSNASHLLGEGAAGGTNGSCCIGDAPMQTSPSRFVEVEPSEEGFAALGGDTPRGNRRT